MNQGGVCIFAQQKSLYLEKYLEFMTHTTFMDSWKSLNIKISCDLPKKQNEL